MNKIQFINKDDTKADNRVKQIVRTCVIGILANAILASVKIIIGLASNSIAIILDAVNNITDAASSVITIVGTKFAAKSPDKKHPFGYGRVEYLGALIISVIIFYAGISSLVEAIKMIINPITPTYLSQSLIIVAIGVVIKFILAHYVKKVGREVNSNSLIGSGQEAMLDGFISISTLIAAGIFINFGISLEAYLGTIISLLIIKSALDLLRETLSQLLGESNDPELVREVKKTVAAYPGVKGAYDLVLNNYGPDSWNGSIHIEVPDTFTADDLDKMTREIQMAVYLKHNIILTAVGIYSINTQNPQIIEMRDNINELVLTHKYAKQIHGFYVDEETKTIRFDVVISLDADERFKVFDEIVRDIEKHYPGYGVEGFPDIDFSGL